MKSPFLKYILKTVGYFFAGLSVLVLLLIVISLFINLSNPSFDDKTAPLLGSIMIIGFFALIFYLSLKVIRFANKDESKVELEVVNKQKYNLLQRIFSNIPKHITQRLLITFEYFKIKPYMVIIIILMGIASLKDTVGYYYRFTSPTDSFICHDFFCFEKGEACKYNVIGSLTGKVNGNQIALYACPLHPLKATETGYVIDRPNIFSLILAILPFLALYLYIRKGKEK